MGSLPGWDSVESTHAIAHWLHISAIVVLGMLVVAEGMALVYDTRNSTLSVAAQHAAEEQRKRDTETAEARRKEEAEAAETRRKAEVGALERQLTEADKKVTELQRHQTPRRLSQADAEALISRLSPYRGQRVDVTATMNDGEAMQYAMDFLSAFKAAGWDTGTGLSQIATDPPGPTGIEPSLNQAETQAGRVPRGFEPLITALAALNLIESRQGFLNPGTQPGLIEFRVGRKPPPK